MCLSTRLITSYKLHFCFLLFKVYQVNCECEPDLYQINGGYPITLEKYNNLSTFQVQYCYDRSEGGGLDAATAGCGPSYNPWSWDADKEGASCQRFINSKIVHCPCYCHICRPSGGYAVCASRKNYYDTYCYNALGICPSCSLGTYNLGCGCIKCDGKTDYDESIYKFNGGEKCKKADSTSRIGWICGPGICAPCPPGYMCLTSIGIVLPTKCPVGSFKRESGYGVCNACECARGKYFNNGYNSQTDCDHVNGLTSAQCLTCTECTDPQNYTSQNNNYKSDDASAAICPSRNYGRGYDKNGNCVPCIFCVNPKEFALPLSMDYYCLTDNLNEATKCKERYYSIAYDSDNDPEQSQSIELMVDEKMPWKPMYKRNYPKIRNTPGDTGKTFANGGGHRGHLPFYTKCVNFDKIYGGAYEPVNNTAIIQILTDDMDWQFDCMRQFTAQCSHNHYAIISDVDKYVGIPSLIRCLPCQNNTTPPTDHRAMKCDCGRGSASQISFREKYGELDVMLPYGTAIDGRLCVDCFNSVYWKHNVNGYLWQEALTCTSDNGYGINNCRGLTFVNKADQICSACQKEFFTVDGNNTVVIMSSDIPTHFFDIDHYNISNTTTANISFDDLTNTSIVNSTAIVSSNISNIPGDTQVYATSTQALIIRQFKQKIPHLSRTGCYYCSVGTHYNYVGGNIEDRDGDGFYECEECNAGQYQDFEGQPICKNKAIRCSPGYKLQMNNLADKDHDCVSCDKRCGDNQITVMSSNKTFDQDTCDGGGYQFFGCYDGSSDDSGPSFKPGTRLVYTYGATRAVVETCLKDQLPLNSEWVGYRNSQTPGAECYFACSYGVNTAIAGDFTSFIDTYVKQNRADLKRYNKIIVPGTSDKNISIMFDEMWTSGNTGSSNKWSKSSSLSQYKRNDAMTSNTFLFIEAAITEFNAKFNNPNLCISATDAYALQCPSGYARSSSFKPGDYNCARDARENFYCKERVCSVASCVGTTCSQVCVSEDSSPLSNFRVGCTVNCIDLKLNNALSVDLSPSSRWLNPFSFIIAYLRQERWATLGNPYTFVNVGDCSSFMCTPRTFLYSIEDHRSELMSSDAYLRGHSACIPCNAAIINQVCGLFLPVRFPISDDVCSVGVNLTIADVCTSCSQTVDGATLIPKTSEDYSTWLTKRIDTSFYGNIFNSQNINGKLIWNIPCRYYCPQGYTSNNESPEAYLRQPCIACSDVSMSSSCANIGNVPMFYSKIGTCGTVLNNINPFISECKDCSFGTELGKYSFAIDLRQNPVNNQGECLSMCDASLYHSLLKNTTTGVRTPVDRHIPYDYLECEICTANPNIACDGICPGGYYHDNSTLNLLCTKCDESACGNINYYRETCISGSIRDAQCVPCPPDYLKNDPNYYQQNSSNYNLSLLNAMSLTNGYIVRRWVSNVGIKNDENLISVIRTPYPQCFATCINNHVWIDIQTGLFPSQKDLLPLSRLYCIRCDSGYIASGLQPSSVAPLPTLYSFWNNTNESIVIPATRPDSALDNMALRRVKGGCYFCADVNIRNVIETSTQMCELKAGVTNTVQPTPGTAYYTVVGSGGVSMVSIEPSAEIDFGRGWGRRRLLSVQATVGVEQPFTIKKIKIKTQPILRGITYTCCELLTIPSQKFDCKREMDELLESKKLKSGEEWGSDYCKNLIANHTMGGGRRLLMLQQDTASLVDAQGSNIQIDENGTCFTGTYKDKRGDGPCFSCPSGTSTVYPFTGAVDRTQCQCLSGFSSVRVNHSLSYCIACGWNYYRNDFMNDSICIPCAPNMHTPTRASSYCYCDAGFHRNFSDNECVKCEPGFYCPQDGNNARIQCPANSMSGIGAYHRGNCTCNSPAYYGYLLNPTFQCIPRPPGLNCKVDYESSIGSLGNLSCNCAVGWNRIEIENSDNGNGENNIIFRCVSRCEKGNYAVLDSDGMSILQCVQCPINTYSSMSQAIQIKNKPRESQCTPCPPNTDTRGKEGIYNMSECLCSGQIMPTIEAIINNITNNNGNDMVLLNSKCGSCEAGTYLDLSVHTCKKCPEGTISYAGDMTGISSCLCEPGYKATKKLINLMNSNSSSTVFADVSIFCEPCPIGYFSNKFGASCTMCGKYTTTIDIGSKSIRDCIRIQ